MTSHRLTNIDGRKISVKDDIFTWSNFISFTRLFIPFPVIWLHIHNDYHYNNIIIALISYGVISDYLDGVVARKRETVSELGKVLDPVADKLMALLLFSYTLWLGWIPLWYFIVAVIRDLLIIMGSTYIKWLRGKVAMAVLTGKLSVNIMALYWFFVFFFPTAENVHIFLMTASVIMMAVSFVHYFHRFNQIRMGAEFN